MQPHIQDKLRTELKAFQAQHGRFPGFEDLMSATTFPYLDAVMRETSRKKAVLREIGRMVNSLLIFDPVPALPNNDLPGCS